MMNTCNNCRCIKSTHDKASDSEWQSDQPLDSIQKSVLNCYEDRSDNGKCKIAGYKNADKRCYKKIEHCRYDFMKSLLNLCQYPDCNDNRDYMSLISNHVNGVKSEPYFLRSLYAFRGNCPSVLQIRMDHDHTDNRSKVRVGAEYFCTAVSDEDRQECVCCVTEKLCKYINGTVGINVQEAIVYHEVQSFHDSHQESAGYDSRDDRDKNISKRLNESLHRIGLGCCHLLQLFLAALGNSGDLDELIINLVYNSCSKNDLHLSLCEEYTFYSVDILHVFLVCLVIICNDQTKSCCTVGCRNDVFFLSYMIIDFLCDLSVIHVHPPFLLLPDFLSAASFYFSFFCGSYDAYRYNSDMIVISAFFVIHYLCFYEIDSIYV